MLGAPFKQVVQGQGAVATQNWKILDFLAHLLSGFRTPLRIAEAVVLSRSGLVKSQNRTIADGIRLGRECCPLIRNFARWTWLVKNDTHREKKISGDNRTRVGDMLPSIYFLQQCIEKGYLPASARGTPLGQEAWSVQQD